MNRASPNLITFDFSLRWFFIPPVVAIFTRIAAGFFTSDLAVPVDVNPAVWGLVGLMFTLLTVLYGIFIKRLFFRGLLPVQLIAQGILLCPLSLKMGVPALSWVGVLMAICGAVVLVALYYFSRANRIGQQTVITSELDNLPLPFAITDAAGAIISASDYLLHLLQKPRSAVHGGQINAVLPIDQETINMGGREWRVLQTPMDDGAYYFQLEEVHDVTVTLPVNTETTGNFVDTATSLYNRSYAIKRIEEELYRVYRYKRWMSAGLLRVNFGSDPDSRKEEETFNAYCRFVNSNIRETDIPCLVGPREILVVMPETQSDGAQDVVSKLLDFRAHLREEIQGFDGIMDVTERTVFFSASSGVLDYDRLMEKLDEAMNEN